MTPRWSESADKHGVPRGDQIHAILHASFVHDLADESSAGGRITVFIGPAHGQTDRELEILVHRPASGAEALVFHAMELEPKFRRYREDNQ